MGAMGKTTKTSCWCEHLIQNTLDISSHFILRCLESERNIKQWFVYRAFSCASSGFKISDNDGHSTLFKSLWPWRVCICCFCTNLFRCVLPTHVIISHYLCMLSCTKCLLLKGHKVLWVFLVLELLHFSGSLVSHRIVNYILPTVGWTLESV